MKNRKPCFLNIMIFAYTVILLFASYGENVFDFSPETILQTAGIENQERLTVDSLIDLSLNISADGENNSLYYKEQILAYIDQLDAEIEEPLTDYEKGSYVLAFMHRNLLTSYSEWQTNISTLLDTGRYNCVSSAVMYLILAKSQGLLPYGTSTTDHAFCSILINNEEIDIETTTAHGFDPGEKTEFENDFGEITGYSYVPPGNYRTRTTLNERQLLGLILQNRIVELQYQRKYKDALPLAVDMYALMRDTSSGQTLVDGISNYASTLNDQKDYQAGIDLLLEAEGYLEGIYYFDELLDILIYNQILETVNKNQIEDALDIQDLYKDRLSERTRELTNEMIAERRIAVALETESFEYSNSLINQYYEEGALSSSRWTEYLVFLYGNRAAEIASEEGFLEAYNFLKTAPNSIKNNRNIQNALNAFLYNYSVEIHNRYIDLLNEGRDTEASSLLTEGLENYPESSILLQDLSNQNRR